jgi:hypothetical protein
MLQRRTSVTILVLACLILLGFSVEGLSQQQSDTLKTPGKEQSSPAKQPTLKSPRREAAGIEVIADLSVTPLEYTGSCPAVFTFKGWIYANRSTRVEYKFIRSDGVHSEAKTLVFEKEGRQEVTYTLQVGDAANLPAFSGAAIMQVVYPLNMKIQSNEVIFKGTCTNLGRPGPKNPAGQQTVQPGSPAAQSHLPLPSGQQGQPSLPFPPPTGQQGQQGQPAVPLPSPAGKGGEPPMPFPSPTGQQGANR